MTTILPLEQAEKLLQWAAAKNPGQWVDHSRTAARAAGIVTEAIGLDKERAEALGLVHDIGRYNGVTNLRHVYDGWVLMKEKGYGEAAQICLSHSFINQEFVEYLGKNDCSPAQVEEMERALSDAVYTDYDRLIQLCDAICLPEGVCLMEKRLVDVSLRYGVNDLTVAKWKTLFAIWDQFCTASGKNLYALFPEAVSVTFS